MAQEFPEPPAAAVDGFDGAGCESPYLDEVSCTDPNGHEWAYPDERVRTPCINCGYEP